VYGHFGVSFRTFIRTKIFLVDNGFTILEIACASTQLNKQRAIILASRLEAIR
jgi:hypothetical protein